MSEHYFPEEISIEILKRLPVKSIGQFSVVSKQYHALVSCPSFISTHIHHALNDSANEQSSKDDMTLLLRVDKSKQCALIGRRIEKLGFPFQGYYRVVGTSSGLLCLVREFFDGFNGVENVVLWNPSIRRSVKLPRPTIELAIPQVDVFGFGVDLRDCEDCKVVRLVYPKLSEAPEFIRVKPPEVEVYSLKSRAWKWLVQPGVRCRIMPFNKSQVLMNGCVHWLAYWRRERGLKNLVLVFDVTNEVFSEIMVPEELGRGNRVKLCCNLFEKYLTVIKYDWEMEVMSCCIWLMKEYGDVGSWTSTYRFDLVEGMEKVICVLGDGEVLVTKRGNEVVAYNIKTNTIKKIGTFGLGPSFYVDRYVESLVLFGE